MQPNHKPPAPKTFKQPHTICQHNHTRQDDYHWLKAKNWQQVMQDPNYLDAHIRAHLEAENVYSQAILAHTEDLQNNLFDEMKARQPEIDTSPPKFDGAYAYFHRYRENDQYGVYCQQPCLPSERQLTAPPTDILDADLLARTTRRTSSFFDLGTICHSPDHLYLAYCIDQQGAENYDIFVKPMHAGTDHPAQSIASKNSTANLLWARDSKTLLWVEKDSNQRPYAVFAYDISEPDGSPQCIFQEKDSGYFVSVNESNCGRFIEINIHDHTTSEIWLIDANTPFSTPHCFAPREIGREYSLHAQGEHMYILTNAFGATDFQIMRTPLIAPEHFAQANWQPYITHQPGQLIISLESYQDYLVRLVRKDAKPYLIIREMKDKNEHHIAFHDNAYSLGLDSGYEYDTPWLRFAYSSPTTPEQIFDYHMQSREKKRLKTQVIPSGHTPNDYICERLMVTARDGETIPLTLLYRRDLDRQKTHPLLLYGYGAYGITISAGFRITPLSLVDQGFIYAIAHIRGGMAKGYQWYVDGKAGKKLNSIHDFIDSAHALCSLGYSERGRIIAHGGSAGGLLVAAALNQAPELFGGIIAAVPFVDVLNTMSDADLPLTPPEWPEWGNPIDSPQAYEHIAAYCPYQNVRDTHFPPIFITAGLTDPRVTYWEPAKWAARLRDHQKGEAPILLKTTMNAGHQGETGRYDALKDIALEYAFAITIMQNTEKPSPTDNNPANESAP